MDKIFNKEFIEESNMDDILDEFTEEVDAAVERCLMKQKVAQRRKDTYLKRDRLLRIAKRKTYNPRLYPYEIDVWNGDDWECIRRPYAVRAHNSNRSRYAKRRSNRMVRKYKGTLAGCKYKRIHDYWWEVY